MNGLKKQDAIIFCLQETHARCKDTYRLKMKGQKKIFMQIITKREQGWP